MCNTVAIYKCDCTKHYRSSLSTSCNEEEQRRDKKVVPRDVQVVICGGGVIGASVAYHLPKYGFNDVILLEQGRYIQ